MKLTRREILSMAAMAGVAMPFSSALSTSSKKESLVIFDSRLPQSLAFASLEKYKSSDAIDLAHEEFVLWRNIRSQNYQQYDSVVGLTRWTDFVSVRGLLHEQQMRLLSPEIKIKANLGATLFQWDMISRC